MFARNDALGKVTVPLKAIAANKKLELDAWYPLEMFDKMKEVRPTWPLLYVALRPNLSSKDELEYGASGRAPQELTRNTWNSG